MVATGRAAAPALRRVDGVYSTTARAARVDEAKCASQPCAPLPVSVRRLFPGQQPWSLVGARFGVDAQPCVGLEGFLEASAVGMSTSRCGAGVPRLGNFLR